MIREPGIFIELPPHFERALEMHTIEGRRLIKGQRCSLSRLSAADYFRRELSAADARMANSRFTMPPRKPIAET